MANTVDSIVAAITESSVTGITSRTAEEASVGRHDGLVGSTLEAVSGMMTMLAILETRDAEIVIWAVEAGDKLFLGEDLDAAVASTSRGLRHIGRLFFNLLLFVVKRTWHLLWHGELWTSLDSLSSTVDELAILENALDEPVTTVLAMLAGVDASRADVVITLVADVAVIVLVQHDLVAGIAVD